MRRLIGLCCVVGVGLFGFMTGTAGAWAEGPAGSAKTVSKAAMSGAGNPASDADSARLVREVVYNELHDHDSHGYWRYWVERHTSNEILMKEQVETKDGPIERVQLSNGHPLPAEAREDDDRRLQHLLSSPNEQAQHRKAYADDEHRIGRILALLPDAFLYEPLQEQTLSEGLCYHLRFHPNPDYPAHSIESRIFHAMTGDLWISVQSKRLVRLDGKLQENVDFGFGILGRLYKGGWFRLERTNVSSGTGAGDWKTQRLEVHMIGRAMLFKTIARETSEVRGGFTAVPAGLSLQQAAVLIQQPINLGEVGRAPGAQPVAFVSNR